MPIINTNKSPVNLGPAFVPSLNMQPTSASQNKARTPLVTWNQSPGKVTFDKPEQIRPLSDKKLARMKKVNQFFSLSTFKPVLKYGSVFAAAVSMGALLAVFKGAAIQAAFTGMVASSAFPPVMITIAVMVGVGLMAFGVYKFVQNRNAKIALNEAYKAAQLNAQTYGSSLAEDNASFKSSVKAKKVTSPVVEKPLVEETAQAPKATSVPVAPNEWAD